MLTQVYMPPDISYVHPITIVHFVSRFSNRFPPFAEDVVDELGHGLRATRAAPAVLGLSSQTGISHNFGKHEHHLLVMLRSRQLVKLAAALGCQPLAFLSVHLPHVAQVLLIAHQENQRVCVPFSHSKMNLSDEVHYGRGREEGGAIADVVNHHEAVGPVDLLIESGLPFTRLRTGIIQFKIQLASINRHALSVNALC